MAVALAVCVSLPSPPAARAGSPALVADDAGDRVVVFDGTSHAIVGSVAVGSGTVGDCSISDRRGLGYVTAFDSSIWVIDLNASPPALAAGTNPIPISNPGRDTALSADERFLVVCGAGLAAPVSVIDVEARVEVDSFDPGHGCSSVEVCRDGTVLIGFHDLLDNFKIARRLTLDASGQLADTGSTAPFEPENLACSPNSATAVTFELGGDATSFALPTMIELDAVNVYPGSAVAGQVGPRGDRLYARGSDGTDGVVAAFDYDSATGVIGGVPLFELPVSGPPGLSGLDHMSVHPDGSRIYVSEPGMLEVYDAENGGFLTAITHPDIVSPTGVCIGSAIFGDGFESGDVSAWSSVEP